MEAFYISSHCHRVSNLISAVQPASVCAFHSWRYLQSLYISHRYPPDNKSDHDCYDYPLLRKNHLYCQAKPKSKIEYILTHSLKRYANYTNRNQSIQMTFIIACSITQSFQSKNDIQKHMFQYFFRHPISYKLQSLFHYYAPKIVLLAIIMLMNFHIHTILCLTKFSM